MGVLSDSPLQFPKPYTVPLESKRQSLASHETRLDPRKISRIESSAVTCELTAEYRATHFHIIELQKLLLLSVSFNKRF